MSTVTQPVWETYEPVDLSDRFGEITDEQVEKYWRDGWVEVKGFVDPALCEELVQHYKVWTDVHWDEWPDDRAEQEEYRAALTRFKDRRSSGKGQFAAREEDPFIFNFCVQRKIGEATAKLMRVPAVKVFTDTLHCKQPEEVAVAASGQLFYPWHQDYPHMSVDRVEVIQMWLALRDVTPEMGPMVHLTGSHETPPMGAMMQDAPERYPWLFERYQATAAHALAQGDAMFHHPLCWHASAPNTTNRPRWAMTCNRISADCLYTGLSMANTNGLDLPIWKPFDHPNFPTIYEADAN
jgi:ectoine hydroxylase-related dioxygenase (phytanoyl-CoA dioxygenase family)